MLAMVMRWSPWSLVKRRRWPPVDVPSPARSVIVSKFLEGARVRVRTVASAGGHGGCGGMLRVGTVSAERGATATLLTGGSIRHSRQCDHQGNCECERSTPYHRI